MYPTSPNIIKYSSKVGTLDDFTVRMAGFAVWLTMAFDTHGDESWGDELFKVTAQSFNLS
jgi:hypothetical protein